jgi:predicted Zn-dependent protease
MKPSIVVVLAVAAAGIAHAQFGGIVNRAKQGIDNAKEKTKPVSSRAEKAADTFKPWSAEEEQAIGEAGAAKMVAMFGLVDDPALTRYVNLVGQAVAQFASRDLPYRFGVLDADIVGAYALPGGHIFVTRGALSGMTSEAQLAGALAHEVIHCADRHLEREIRAKKTSAWATQEANTAMQGDAALLSRRADAALKDYFSAGLSRDKEEAADEQGTLLAAQAGYSASGLMEVLNAMAAASSKPENRRMFGQLLSTHPPFPDRVARLRPIAEKAGAGKTLVGRFQASVRK